jgi:NADH-quinone oxidoreductase subunit J
MQGSETYAQIVFWIFAATAVVPGLMILIGRNIVRQAFWLLASLSGFAGLYLSLGADFLGFTQVIVYMGGILVLFLFGVMLTRKGDVPIKGEKGWSRVVPGVLAGLLVMGILLYLVLSAPWKETPRGVDSTVETIGGKVMSTFILPFEVVSLLLLVGLVGATYIARRKGAGGRREEVEE